MDPTMSPPHRRQGPQARLEGPFPEHQLQVLRDEEKDPGHDEDGRVHRGQRRAEGGDPEEPQVDQRVG
jgi:hypothetical protein